MNALYSAQHQWAIFCVFAAAGVAAGLWNDAVRTCARPLEGGRLLQAVSGLCVGAGTAVLAGAAALFCAEGELRAYMLAGMLLGGALYRFTLGALARGAMRTIAKTWNAAQRTLSRCALWRRIWK